MGMMGRKKEVLPQSSLPVTFKPNSLKGLNPCAPPPRNMSTAVGGEAWGCWRGRKVGIHTKADPSQANWPAGPPNPLQQAAWQG